VSVVTVILRARARRALRCDGPRLSEKPEPVGFVVFVVCAIQEKSMVERARRP
jgi:hypothetical protein